MIAVFTSGLLATVLAIARATPRGRAHSIVTRCVAPSPSPAIALARSMHTSRAPGRTREVVARQRLAAGRAVGHQQHRVVGAHVSVDADAVEAVAAAASEPGRSPGSRGVGHDQGEHRRHVRAHHRGPLGDSRDLDRAAGNGHAPAGDLLHRVGRDMPRAAE